MALPLNLHFFFFFILQFIKNVLNGIALVVVE